MPNISSKFDFFKRFPNEEAARLFFEENRWGKSPVCGHCGSTNVVECKDLKPMPYRCKDCRKHFSVRTGTILAESRLPLQKWLFAIFVITGAKESFPNAQMCMELEITPKTASFLAKRIRETWLNHCDRKIDRRLKTNTTSLLGHKKTESSN